MTSYRTFLPIVSTLVLVGLTFLTFVTLNGHFFPNLDLIIPVTVFSVLDIGFVVTLVWGLNSKDRFVKWFSLFSNLGFIIPLSIWIFLLALANGISEN